MKIAILSDIHDNLLKLRAALDAVRDAEALLCCGDLCSPFVVPELANGFSGAVHIVFGNNDGDRYRIAENARRHARITIHGEFAELELGGRRIALQHFDDVGRALARGQAHDLVCYGHDHRYEVRAEGRTLAVNPGEVYGGLSGVATCVIYDSETHRARRIDL